MTISYAPSVNIATFTGADLIVNTVNCVGVMGKGVAKAFADAHGKRVLDPYRGAIARGELKPGSCLIFRLSESQHWAAFATKDHWRAPSRIEWVRRGLDELAAGAQARGLRSIAVPPLGCGLGGLNWRDVEPMIVDALGGRFDVIITAEPSSRPAARD